MLSRKEEIILALLLQGDWNEIYKGKYGLEMVAGSHGLLKRGTIYVTLNRMEDKGYVTSRLEETKTGQLGPARRVYIPTEQGFAAYNAMYNEFYTPLIKLKRNISR